MSAPNHKKRVTLIVQFEVEGVENAEQAAADWLNTVLTDAPPVVGLQPRLPIVTVTEYEKQARQLFSTLVERLEACGEIVPDSFRELLSTQAEPSAT